MNLIHKYQDTDYGYHKMTSALKLIGYNINHKKVYRLMKEAQLPKDKHQQWFLL